MMNVCPAKGALALDPGGLTVSGRPVVSAGGEMLRRVNQDFPEEFKVSGNFGLSNDQWAKGQSLSIACNPQ